MPNDDLTLSRRRALVGSAAAVAVAALPACSPGATMTSPRLPVVYLPHGGGPWPFVDMGLPQADIDHMASYLRGVRKLPQATPKAALVISAHWEERVPTVMTAARPPMLYDYYNFPPESYTLTWPAPGAPALASRVRDLLGAAGLDSEENPERGFDHGTFIPLKLTWPDAELPTTQLSLKVGLDPTEHLAIGRALAPLRDEGVFIIGSGMSMHNLRGLGDPRMGPISETFDAWLQDTVRASPTERDDRLKNWASAPAARLAHPREEHLLPLMVVAGAAGEDVGTVPYSETFMGWRVSAAHFGA